MQEQDIATKSRTNEILKKYNLLAKKSFGQNFLIDNNIVRNIVSEADIDKETCVIEIGPGIGGLSQELARRAKKVVCVEIDERLKPVLNESLASCDNISIVYADFLKLDLVEFVKEHFSSTDKIVVVANLPYYITTAILIKIFEAQTRVNIVRICAMMQKEVGLRLSASKSTKDYNSLTILTQYYCDAKIVIKVPKTVFIPAPNVDSVVVLFTMKDQSNKPDNEQLFFNLLRVLFKQRRKTILNNLNELVNDKDKTRDILLQVELKDNLRAENLSLDDIIMLSNYLNKEGMYD